MKNKLTIVLSVVLSVVLTTAINIGVPAVKGMKAFDPAATSLGTAFTYQGRLEKNGQPVSNMTCSFKFGLYDADSGGSPLSSGIQTIDLALTNGLFTATLDFGTVFNGDARWLEIAARCPGDTEYTIIGRQPLTATPYALYAKKVEMTNKTGFTAVQAAAFQPVTNGYYYEIYRYEHVLRNLSGNINNAYWMAPVQIPNGAIITKITYYWLDASASYNTYIIFECFDLFSNMPCGNTTSISSSGSPGVGTTVYSDINFDPVDNSSHTYNIEAFIYDNACLVSVVIEYSYMSLD